MEPAQNEVQRLHVVTIRHDMSETEFVHWKGKKSRLHSFFVQQYIRPALGYIACDIG